MKQKRYEFAIFAGVGIVKSDIIESISRYCLNAHPAPLPNCRGGGALECTLYNGLNPGVSVHQATEGIDEGDIFSLTDLALRESDNFLTVSVRLDELCAEQLVLVLNKFLRGQDLNMGKMLGN